MSTDVILADTTQTARKSHLCDQCLTAIKIGERYRRLRGVWDGCPGIWRAHDDCNAVAQAIHQNGNLMWDEAVCLMDDVMPEDHEWIITEYPAVAARLGLRVMAGAGGGVL